jgi:hypothetical protein
MKLNSNQKDLMLSILNELRHDATAPMDVSVAATTLMCYFEEGEQ